MLFQRRSPSKNRTHRRANRALRFEPLEGRLPLATFVVSNTNNAGAGSLRTAIVDSNNAATVDMINFNIPGGGVEVITVQSALPAITGQVTINGNSQPGFAGTPLIELTSNAVSGNGLAINASGSVVKGLWIYNFAGSGIRLSADDCTIAGNGLGAALTATGVPTDSTASPSRRAPPGTGLGALLPRPRITSLATTARVFCSRAKVPRAMSCREIESEASGAVSLSNRLGMWIASGASGNFIGTAVAGGGNVISVNEFSGISITGNGTNSNVIVNNQIGGYGIAGSPTGNGQHGVYIGGGISSNRIGGTTAAARNIISENLESGVQIEGPTTTGNTVLGNYIGTNPNGDAAFGNRFGVFIGNRAHDNIVGGTASGSTNVISGNLQAGVVIDGPGIRAISCNATALAPIPRARRRSPMSTA